MLNYKLEGRIRNDGLINIYIEGTNNDVALCVKPSIASLFINSPELLKALDEKDCDCGVFDRKKLIDKINGI